MKPVETKIASVKSFKPGKMMGVQSQGRDILVADVGGNYYAIGNVCTHEQCNLADGVLEGEVVQCPCHGSSFNVKTGQVVTGPAEKPEPTYQLKVAGDQIMLVT
jgi:nitrite reductase/ring-hydroxylating ferredoxin subunit